MEPAEAGGEGTRTGTEALPAAAATERLFALLAGSRNVAMLCGPPRSGKSTVARSVARRLVDAGRFARIKIMDEEKVCCTSTIPHHKRMDRWTGAGTGRTRESEGESEGGEERVVMLIDDVDSVLLAGDALHLVRVLQEAARSASSSASSASSATVSVLLVSSHPNPWPNTGRRLRQTFAAIVPPSSVVVLAPPTEVDAGRCPSPSSDPPKRLARSSRRNKDKSAEQYRTIREFLDVQLINCTHEGSRMMLVANPDEDEQRRYDIEDYDDESAAQLTANITRAIVAIRPLAPP